MEKLQWSSKVFENVSIIPPETGTAHQVNLEYLSRVVFDVKDFLHPDSVVGTDSHTTMVNGLGILGWGKYAQNFIALGKATKASLKNISSHWVFVSQA